MLKAANIFTAMEGTLRAASDNSALPLDYVQLDDYIRKRAVQRRHESAVKRAIWDLTLGLAQIRGATECTILHQALKSRTTKLTIWKYMALQLEPTPFTVLIIGADNVGKTSFMESLSGGTAPRLPRLTADLFRYDDNESEAESDRRREECYGAVRSVDFATTSGLVQFNMKDACTLSSKKWWKMRDIIYSGAHAAIIMFDLTHRITYKSVSNWYRDVIRTVGRIPIVLVGTKSDLTAERRVKPKSITFHRKKSIPYFEVSLKTPNSFAQPFLWLAQRMSGDDDLAFVPEPARQIPLPLLDEERAARLRRQLEVAATVPIGRDDDL